MLIPICSVWFWTHCHSSSIINAHSPEFTAISFLLPVTMEARTRRPDIAAGATVILDTYWSLSGRSLIDRRRNIDRPDDVLATDATQQAGRVPQHVDCARAAHAHCDVEPETQRRSSKSAEINDRDRFKRHARLPGACSVRMFDVRLVGTTRLSDFCYQHLNHQQLVSMS